MSKTKNIVATIFSILLIATIFRAVFDPCIYLSELPYKDFKALLESATPSAQIETLYLQKGQTDFWGRPIVEVKMRYQCGRKVVHLPEEDALSTTISERIRTHGVSATACDSAEWIVQILLTWFFSVIFLVQLNRFKPKAAHQTKPT
ncbi:hypothetical protein BH11CYA1_BH11CYA1_07570 [soil metagenome]